MSEIDNDGNGFIDLHKFADFHRRESDKSRPRAEHSPPHRQILGPPLKSDDSDESSNQELRDAFDLYDQDGNGLISAKKLHAVLKSLGEKCSWRDCLKMIKSIDVDGD
ncbi:putative calcium-binding protein CML18 [Camellia lanceoleosa]|nr:putative calcium-binding protein CML18 [Camellia lanceoleosa]